MSKFIRFILVSICACATYAGLKYAFMLFITWLMFSGVYFDGPGALLGIPLTFLSSSGIFDYYCIALGSHYRCLKGVARKRGGFYLYFFS